MLDRIDFKAMWSGLFGTLAHVSAMCRHRIWLLWYSRQGYRWFIVPSLVVIAVSLGTAIYYAIPEVEKRKQLKCLALNVYHEARGERTAGQYAVAEVTMNRVASKHYPNTVCDVVYQGGWDKHYKRYVGAFSWTELDLKSEFEHDMWVKAKKVAVDVYAGDYKSRVKGALFYHARYIKKPIWAKRKRVVARIGRHIFY
jgi:spore germination cell wall hydrolase CwlJ-like protein